MKRTYLIVPLVLLALFGGVYAQKRAELDERHRLEAETKTAADRAAAAQKVAAETKAREDAEKRSKAGAAEEAKKQEEKLARREADLRAIATESKAFAEEAGSLSKQTEAAEKKLGELKALRRAASDDTFARERASELADISRRNAEIEVQRLVEIVSRRATGVQLAPVEGLVVAGR